MIVYLIDKEFPLAAENPISFAAVLDPESLIEPPFVHENVNKPPQDIHGLLFYRISKLSVSRFHVAPHCKVYQKTPRRHIFNTGRKMTPF